MHNAHVKNLSHGRPSFENILMKMTLTIGCKNYTIANIINFPHFSFSLSPPLPAVPEMTPQFVCETASRSHNHHDNQNHHHYCNNHRHYTITTIIIFSDCCSCLSIGRADFPSSVLFLIPHRLQAYSRPFMKYWSTYVGGNIKHHHHHKNQNQQTICGISIAAPQVSLMRNSWSDLFLLGLVQVQLNQIQIRLKSKLPQCRTQLCLPSLLSALASQLSHWLEEDRLPLQR